MSLKNSPIPSYETNTVTDKKEDRDLDTLDRIALRLFGDYFKKHKENYRGFQRTLNQAQMSDGYDLYLSRILLWFLILLGASLAISLSVTAVLFGFIPEFSIDLAFNAGQYSLPSFIPSINVGLEMPELSLPEGVLEPVYEIGPLFVTALLSLLLTFIMAGIPTLTMYLMPWYKAGEREREIDTMLPYTVTFMYALSRGGANLLNIMRTVSQSGDVYGEASDEFRLVVRDMEFFDSDIRRALRNAAQESPSKKFTDFIDDLVSIVDTGGDLEGFLYDKTEDFLLEARREQENFLDTLSLMGEIYVTAFVAGPLFVIIIVTVMALIGGSSIFMLYAIVYGILPLGNVGFAFLIDVLKSGKQAESELDDYSGKMGLDELEDKAKNHEDSRIKNLYKKNRREHWKEIVLNPYNTFREHPSWTLVLTFPLTLIYLGAVYYLLGIPEPMIENSIKITSAYLVGPIGIFLIPISAFHEIKTRRQGRILKNIPSMLKKLSSSNATGVSLKESFEIVARSTAGEMGEELRNVRNEIDWRGDLNEALIRFAKRIDTPRLSRTVKLITMASRSTGNITDVIDVAAKDVTQTHRLEEDRQQEMALYTVIIIVSFLVYLLVIVMLNEAFLSEIASLAEQGQQSSQQLSGTAGFSLSNLPVNLYNMVFFHSTIIQAFGAGLIAGQMGSDDMISGLKFSLGMIAVSTIVFLVL